MKQALPGMCEDEDEVVPLAMGHAETVKPGGDEATGYAAVLWIPDPTERRGWRDLWIEKKPDGKPKPVGFGRRP
jgi:hypothetical protein